MLGKKVAAEIKNSAPRSTAIVEFCRFFMPWVLGMIPAFA
jgi:hypothetical protein